MTWFTRASSRRERDALLDYWDEVIAQSPAMPVPPATVPGELAALVRTVHTADATSPDHPAYEDRLLRTLLARQKEIAPMNATAATAPPLSPLGTPGLTSKPHRRADRSQAFALPPALGIALIVLLILASIAGIWLATDRHDEPHRMMAPVVATPSPDASPGWSHFKGDSARRGETNSGPVDQPAELWRHQANGPCVPVPAVVGDTVYAPCEDTTLYALDAATGEVRWTFAAEPPVPFVDGTAVSGDLVYAIGGDNALYAVDLDTGEERWRFDATPIVLTPAVDDGLAVTGTLDGFLIGIDAATGEEQWRYQVTEGGAPRVPAMLDGVAYAGSETGDFTAIDVATGELLWTVDTGENSTGTAVVADGIAYIGTSADDQTGSLAAYDAETGELLWRRDEPMHSPSVSNDVGYSGSADGTVYAFDTATGEERWRIKVGGVARPLAVAGDMLYIPSDGDRAVYAVDIATGEELWHVDVDGNIDSQAAVADGRISVATTSGVIQVFGESEAGVIAATPKASTAASPSAMLTGSPAASPMASQNIVIEFVWQSTGGPDPLLVPTGIAVAPDGTIWVVDSANNRIQIFSPDGEHLETWGEAGDGEGELNFVRSPDDPGNSVGAIAFAPDGSFYVADTANMRVQHFATDRTFIRAWGSFGTGDGQFIDPLGVAVAPDGNVYVVDDRRDDIQVFDPEGTYLFTVGEHGTGPGQLNSTGSLAIDVDGNVWVADFGNNRIQQFAADGTFIKMFGEPGRGDGQFTRPAGIAIDQDGNLYVSEPDIGRVQVFTPEGALLVAWLGVDDGQGEPFVPLGIAVNGEGVLYVADVVSGTVQRFEVTLPAMPGATPVT